MLLGWIQVKTLTVSLSAPPKNDRISLPVAADLEDFAGAMVVALVCRVWGCASDVRLTRRVTFCHSTARSVTRLPPPFIC